MENVSSDYVPQAVVQKQIEEYYATASIDQLIEDEAVYELAKRLREALERIEELNKQLLDALMAVQP